MDTTMDKLLLNAMKNANSKNSDPLILPDEIKTMLKDISEDTQSSTHKRTEIANKLEKKRVKKLTKLFEADRGKFVAIQVTNAVYNLFNGNMFDFIDLALSERYDPTRYNNGKEYVDHIVNDIFGNTPKLTKGIYKYDLVKLMLLVANVSCDQNKVYYPEEIRNAIRDLEQGLGDEPKNMGARWATNSGDLNCIIWEGQLPEYPVLADKGSEEYGSKHIMSCTVYGHRYNSVYNEEDAEGHEISITSKEFINKDGTLYYKDGGHGPECLRKVVLRHWIDDYNHEYFHGNAQFYVKVDGAKNTLMWLVDKYWTEVVLDYGYWQAGTYDGNMSDIKDSMTESTRKNIPQAFWLKFADERKQRRDESEGYCVLWDVREKIEKYLNSLNYVSEPQDAQSIIKHIKIMMPSPPSDDLFRDANPSDITCKSIKSKINNVPDWVWRRYIAEEKQLEYLDKSYSAFNQKIRDIEKYLDSLEHKSKSQEAQSIIKNVKEIISPPLPTSNPYKELGL